MPRTEQVDEAKIDGLDLFGFHVLLEFLEGREHGALLYHSPLGGGGLWAQDEANYLHHVAASKNAASRGCQAADAVPRACDWLRFVA